MKVKVVDRTANVAWSPRHQYPIYLAAGTAAQQLDASFSTSAALELYSLNLGDPGFEMGLKSATQSEHRFHKLAWGTHGQSSGTIIGGCDAGVIQIYDVTKLLNGEPSLMSQQNKHKGPVKGLDFNTFQSNLLASTASESEIYIWDLNNPSSPMTPGSKSQPFEEITSVAWNKQVQHILASAFPTKCVVWDLRKNDPIIKLTDTNVRTKWNVVVWNPEVATQLCLGSEDDQSPVIQLWDLRFATAPLKVFENHQKGVLSISWCCQDTDMLLSCGRDNKIICWNPNNNQPGDDIICEFFLNNQWNFDVSWCPRNPALFASSSFDGHVNIYSIMGGPQQVQTSNKIADSFPGMENYTQAPISTTHTMPVSLKRPPKWLKKPVGAKFGFGGRLITFENVINSNENLYSRVVFLSQIITESQLVSRSSEFESVLQSNQHADFCQNKVLHSTTEHEKMIWQFLAANFEISPKTEFLNLLGFKNEDLNKKISKIWKKSSNTQINEMQQITNNIACLGKSADSEYEIQASDDVTNQKNFTGKNLTGGSEKTNNENFQISIGDDIDGLICQALLLGDLENAVELCLQNKKMADAIILAMTGGSELLAKTQYIYLQQCKEPLSKLISAVVTEDWINVVKNCEVDSWKEALAAAITHANDQEFPVLCEILGERLEKEKNGSFCNYAEICYICAGNLNKVVDSWVKKGKSITPDNLQDLFELIMILKKALESRGAHVEMSGSLAVLLSNYAGLLVSQGRRESALFYLNNSNDESVADLKDRLTGSLGKNIKFVQSSIKNPSSHSSKTRGISGFYAPQNIQEELVSAPPTSQHNFNLNPLHGNFAAAPFVPVPPIAPGAGAHPPQQTAPPPPLASRAFPSPSPSPGGLLSRSKHVLDPSVQSASSHSNYYSQNQFQSPVFSQSIHSNPPYNANSGGYPVEAFNPPIASPTPPPSMSATYSSASQPPGWNDPPVVDSSKNFPKTEFVQQNPITQPLLGGPTGDSTANGQTQDPYLFPKPGMQHSRPLPPTQTLTHLSQFQSYSGQQLPYPRFPTSIPPHVNAPESLPARPAAPEPIKKPIPEEHVLLQNLFDELKNKCAMTANNPQSKRKLEEVSKKLEVLYDGLREGKLSQNTLYGLHLIAQSVQAGDYTNGLALHTQLVSGPDFSQIAGFMPGIKVLLQSALQLQVYM